MLPEFRQCLVAEDRRSPLAIASSIAFGTLPGSRRCRVQLGCRKICDWKNSSRSLAWERKPGKPHPLADAKLPGETPQLFLHWSFACDRKAGGRILLLKRGEGAQAGLEPLFLDQAGRPAKLPPPSLRPGPGTKRKFPPTECRCDEDRFSLQEQPKRPTARSQRLRSHQDKTRRAQHLRVAAR